MSNELKINRNYNIVVKLTTDCPGNCLCCTNRKKEIKNKNENNRIFDVSVFDRLCKNIQKIGGTYICLSGGEPTIVKNIDDYFEIAHSYGLATRINTNGWNVNKLQLKKWISLGLEQIVLSVYSLNENGIKTIRGNDKLLHRTIKAAKTICELKKSYDFLFVIQTVIMKNNYCEMPKLLEFAIKNNADAFWPSYLEDAINLPDIRMEHTDIDLFKAKITPEMKSVIDKYFHNGKKHLYSSLEGIYKNYYDNYIYHLETYQCHWLGRHLTLYPNGTIYPCPGHDYFSSNCQYKINYDSIDEFITTENINKNKFNNSYHCKYCPQGVFQEIKLSNKRL